MRVHRSVQRRHAAARTGGKVPAVCPLPCDSEVSIEKTAPRTDAIMGRVFMSSGDHSL